MEQPGDQGETEADALAESEEEVVEGEVLEAAAEKVANQAIRLLASRFSGPLPPPGALAAYEDLSPGTAERIIQMAEREQTHRHELEDKEFDVQTEFGRRGQFFGLIVALAGLGVALWLGLSGKQIAASVVGGLDLVGLVAVFVARQLRTEPHVHADSN